MHKKVYRWVQAIIKWVGSVQSLVGHTLFYTSFLFWPVFGISWATVLLLVTTIVSVESIYLSILIQLTVNMDARYFKDLERKVKHIHDTADEILDTVEEAIEQAEDEILDDCDCKHKPVGK